MMNNVYVVEKEFFSSYDSDGGSIEILGNLSKSRRC